MQLRRQREFTRSQNMTDTHSGFPPLANLLKSKMGYAGYADIPGGPFQMTADSRHILRLMLDRRVVGSISHFSFELWLTN